MNENESYCYRRQLKQPFDETLISLRKSMVYEGFNIHYEINVCDIIKEALGDLQSQYRIIGACNPDYALQAILAEPSVGTLLPCNTIICELDDGIEVAVADLVYKLGDTQNQTLLKIAHNITDRLRDIIENL